MDIKNIIVHEVDKFKSETSGDSVVRVNPRKEENPINKHSISLVSQLTKLFRNTGLSSGNFKEPADDQDDISKFEKLLNKNFVNSEFFDYVNFTQIAARDFRDILSKAANAKGGYLWFNHYIFNEKHFLSVVLLRKKDTLRIKDLSLDPVEGIDLDKLHMAARVNLSDWRANDPLKTRYISFRVGKSSGGVTDYFSDFIGCQEYTVAKEDTADLIDITIEFCKNHKLTPEKTEFAKHEVYDKCKGWVDDDQPVLLKNISTLLDTLFSYEDNNSGRFLEIAQSEPYSLNNEIKIDRTILGNLLRYRGNNSKMNISFNSDLLDDLVVFDPTTEHLIFKEIPSKLLVQLRKREAD